ncbi:MAG: hypothetical protein ACYC99_03105 [Candidatus Geothermincolia bacterium]
MESKKPTAELSLREARVVQGFLHGRTATDAMIAAGYSRSTSISRPYSVLEKSRVKEAMRDAMDRQGLTAARLAKTIEAGLNATRKVVSGSQIVEEPDYAMRHKFVETAIRLRGEDPDRETRATIETHEQRIRRLRGLAPVT